MSSYLKVKNRAVSTLASGVNDTDTSWTLATGEGARFPTSGDFHVTCENEIVNCTSRSTDVLTVVREVEGTTKAAHASGKAVELRITAGVIENLQRVTGEDLTYYVDPTSGNDATGDGSSGSPWATINKAIQYLKDNTPVIIHAVTIAVGKGTDTLTKEMDVEDLIIPGRLNILSQDASDNALYTHGTASSGTATTLVDSSKAWTVDFWINSWVVIYDGTGRGQKRKITDSDATSLTVSAWGTNPDATSKYFICTTEINGDGTERAFSVSDCSAVTFEGFYLTNYPADNFIMGIGLSTGWRIRHCLIDSVGSYGISFNFAYADMSYIGVWAKSNALRVHNNGRVECVLATFVGPGSGTGLVVERGGVLTLSNTNKIYIDGWATGVLSETDGITFGVSTANYGTNTIDYAIGISRCRAYRTTSAQSIPNATATKVELNAESYDDQNEYDEVTNFRFTATEAGRYLVTATVQYGTPVAAKLYAAYIYVDGALVEKSISHASHAATLTVPVAGIVTLAVGEYIELWTYHSSGAARSIALGSTNTRMEIHKIS